MIKWLINKDLPRWVIREAIYLKYILQTIMVYILLDTARYSFGLENYAWNLAIIVLTTWCIIESILLPRKSHEHEYLKIKVIQVIISRKGSKVRPISSALSQSKE